MTVLHVVFKVANTEYAIPAAEVLQMESYTGATAVPGAPPHVAGIVQVRGKVVPVVDLRARFGLPPVELSLDSRIIVGQKGERPVALIVDSAREVVKLAPDEIGPTPRAGGSGEGAGWVKAVARVGSRLVMLIDFEKVIGEDTAHG